MNAEHYVKSQCITENAAVKMVTETLKTTLSGEHNKVEIPDVPAFLDSH